MKVASSFGLGRPLERLETRCGHNHKIPKSGRFKAMTWDNALVALVVGKDHALVQVFLELIDAEPSFGANLTIC